MNQFPKNLIVVIFAIIVALILVLIFFVFPDNLDINFNEPNNTPSVKGPSELPPAPALIPAPQMQQVTEHKITFADNAYSPKELTIKKGDIVRWVNIGDRHTWPASAIHPTHGVYPGSGIEKCNTVAEFNIFDACRVVPPGASWRFRFNEVGEWRYHDHLDPKAFGAVIVTE